MGYIVWQEPMRSLPSRSHQLSHSARLTAQAVHAVNFRVARSLSFLVLVSSFLAMLGFVTMRFASSKPSEAEVLAGRTSPCTPSTAGPPRWTFRYDEWLVCGAEELLVAELGGCSREEADVPEEMRGEKLAPAPPRRISLGESRSLWFPSWSAAGLGLERRLWRA